jgi:TATA-binding protein-associated factor Taf7
MYKQTRERKQTQFFRDIEWDGEGFETRADAAFIVTDSEKAIQKAAEDHMIIDGLDILDAAAEAQSESESDDEEDSEDCWSEMSEDDDDDSEDEDDDEEDSEPIHGQPPPYEVPEQSLAKDRGEGWWL